MGKLLTGMVIAISILLAITSIVLILWDNDTFFSSGNSTAIKTDGIHERAETPFIPSSDIGYRIFNGTLDVWNTKDHYYFNVSNGMQFTNHYNDYWTHNVFCLGYYSSGSWNKIACADELTNFSKTVESDNLTYVNATLWKDFNYGGYDLRIAIRYSLEVNDNNLTVVIYGKNLDIDAIPYSLGFAWIVKDVEIPDREGSDKIFINNTNYDLYGTYDLTFSNMTEKTIVRNNATNISQNVYAPISSLRMFDTYQFLKLDWDSNLDYAVKMYGNGNQNAFYVATMFNAGTFASGVEKSTKFYWIDAEGDYSGKYWDITTLGANGVYGMAVVNITGQETMHGCSYALTHWELYMNGTIKGGTSWSNFVSGQCLGLAYYGDWLWTANTTSIGKHNASTGVYAGVSYLTSGQVTYTNGIAVDKDFVWVLSEAKKVCKYNSTNGSYAGEFALASVNAGIGVWLDYLFLGFDGRQTIMKYTKAGVWVANFTRTVPNINGVAITLNNTQIFYGDYADKFIYLYEGMGYPIVPTVNDVNATLYVPVDYFNSSVANVSFFCQGNSTSTGVTNITLRIDGEWTKTIANITANQNVSLNWSVDLTEGNHNWTCTVSSMTNLTTVLPNRTLTVDLTSPVITQIGNITNLTTNFLPKNLTWWFNVTDTLLDSCWYSINDPLTEDCYQETANQSSINDGSCNLNYSGAYNLTNQVFFVNYSKPVGMEGAIWQIKIGGLSSLAQNITANNTNFSNCLNNFDDKLVLRLVSNNNGGGFSEVSSSCYNSSDWLTTSRTTGIGTVDNAGGCGNNIYDGNWNTYCEYWSGTWWSSTTSVGVTALLFEEAVIWQDVIDYENVTCNSKITTSFNTDGFKTITACANDTGNRVSCNETAFWVYYWNSTMNESRDPVGEGNSVVYDLQVNITGMQTKWGESNATFTFNNTAYQPDSITKYPNYTIFSKTISMVNGLGNSTGRKLYWNWTFNIQNSTTNILAKTTETSTTSVYSVSFDSCSSNSRKILNLTLMDEETALAMNKTVMNIELDINVSKGAMSWDYHTSYTADNTNGTALEQIVVCVPDGLLNTSSYDIDFTVGFEGTDYVKEFYFLDNGVLDNSTNFNSYTDNTIELYDLLSADSTTFLFTYTDESDQEVDDVIVHTFRRYIGDGLYREVERSRQDNSGQTHVHLVEEDVIYYFMITQYGNILYTSGEYNAKCLSTPCEITLSASATDVNWSIIDNEGGQYSVSTDKSTRTATVTFSLGSSAKVNATVFQFLNGTMIAVAQDSLTASAGSISLPVPLAYDNSTFFVAIYNNDEFVKSAWITLKEDAQDYFGTMGAILGGLIVLSLMLMAVAEGVAFIVLIILAVIVISIMQLVDLSWMAIISLACAGAIIIFKLIKRKGVRQ